MGCTQSGEDAVNSKMKKVEKVIKKNNEQIVDELWTKYDTDKSGYLEFNELRSVIVEVTQHIHGKENAMYFIPSHDSMKAYFTNIDADGSGEVSKAEFLGFVHQEFEDNK